jgi:choline dehydrogenase
MTNHQQYFDFIVVGSGAGGGVLAARLARNNGNLKVLLIDAGGDPRSNIYYQVPGFHALATERPELRWDYFVEHFIDPVRASEDDKYEPGRGIFYPRSSGIGGCTAHHAMITVYPDRSDWDNIANITRDPSWSSDQMWRYFERCTDPHGFGWLNIEAIGAATALSAVKDQRVTEIVFAAVKNAPHLAQGLAEGVLGQIDDFFKAAPQTVFGDPNNLRQIRGDREGLYRIPLSTKSGVRRGVTEFVMDTNHHPVFHNNLTIWTNTLVTKVVFENNRAAGVQFLVKPRAYRADRDAKAGDQRAWADVQAELQTVYATKEVILSAGAYNSPQLLMLSGVGPKARLNELGVTLVKDTPGVGKNLQDRYEIPVIDQLDDEFTLLEDLTFDAGPDDKGFLTWSKDGTGFYATNGGTIAIMLRSDPAAPVAQDCDLFIFGIPGEFAGYKLNYSDRIHTPEGRSRFSWIILKAHTNNIGEVNLRTADPRDPPLINLKSFGDGKRQNDPDLIALERGVDYIRKFMAPLRGRVTRGEYLPGDARTGQALRDFIMTRAWGHHASCTCPIGIRPEDGAVLDSQFRVMGVSNLRVVDASVFPNIPGYFIVLPIYLVAEKAADVVLKSYDAVTMPG